MRISDWSSDVCSSDLRKPPLSFRRRRLASPKVSVLACSSESMLTCLNETRPRQMEHDCSPASLSCSIQTQRMHNMALPYRSTPVFDETSLPAALRGEHRTKAGVWGLIRVLEGKIGRAHV